MSSYGSWGPVEEWATLKPKTPTNSRRINMRNIVIFTAVLMGLALTCGGSDACRWIDPGPLVGKTLGAEPTITTLIERINSFRATLQACCGLAPERWTQWEKQADANNLDEWGRMHRQIKELEFRIQMLEEK